MFDFLFNLSIKGIIILYAVIIMANIVFILITKNIVNKKYKKTQSVEEALYLEGRLFKYVHFTLFIISVFVSTLAIAPHIEVNENLDMFIVIGIGFLLAIIILIIDSLIMHKTNQELRKTTTTQKEQISNIAIGMIFGAIPMMIIFAVLEIEPESLNISDSYRVPFKIGLVILVYILMTLIIPFFYKYLFKAVPFRDNDKANAISDFIKQTGINNFKLFLWPTKNGKVANALVAGLVRKDIYITDYLLENFTLEETKAIVAHEIGHIKKKHLWKRTGLAIGGLFLFMLTGFFMNKYEEMFADIPIWIGIILFVLIYLFYFVFLIKYISRIQEMQADEYVLSLGIEPEVMITSLFKLAKLNNTVMKFKKHDETFQTHPGYDRRIKWIMKKGNISEESLNNILNLNS